MKFDFATATQIIFGAGRLNDVGKLSQGIGRRALVVTGKTPQRAERLLTLLQEQGIETDTFPVATEPQIETVREAVRLATDKSCDLIVSIGGGSVIDAGKAIAAMLTNKGDLLDHLEVIGRGQPLSKPSAPFIAIPTTAGTGSEVTRNAVLASPEHQVKVSLRSPLMLPKLALVDPELTYDLPPSVTATTGLDAITQLIEPYVSSRANPLTDAICVEGLRLAARSLRSAVAKGRNATKARDDMATASLFGGLALANAGLGAVHGFAGPIGGMFPAPHGALCAALLPVVMEVNLRALRMRQPAHPALGKFCSIAGLVTNQISADAANTIKWLNDLVAEIQIPRLGHYGISTEHFETITAKARNASSMKTNPIDLTDDELLEILERSI